jgi:general stress protein 26
MAKDKGKDSGKDSGRDSGKGDSSKKLRKLVKGARVAMLTTVAADGSLRSRPMAALKAALGEDLWFFTRASAPKTDEIRDHDRVNVTFSDGEADRYLSVSGRASIVRDPARIEELWSGRLKAWFPNGRKDPDLALLRVQIEHAEYWDSKKAAMVVLGTAPAPSPSAPRPAVDNRNPQGPANPVSGAQG